MIHGEGRETWLVGTAGCISCRERSEIHRLGGRDRGPVGASAATSGGIGHCRSQ